MDPDITSWILEFLCRQPVSHLLLNKFLTNPHISLSNTNPRLKKTVLLRSIQDLAANGSASSETILDSLETIHELDIKHNVQITDSMKLAYQAVAVDSTVKWVTGKNDKGQLFVAVQRIWRDRFERLELLKKSELVTDGLKEIKDDMEAALWDSNAFKRLLGRDLKNEALRLVKDYLNEAWDKMGPSFLELAAKSERGELEKQKSSAEVGVRADIEPNAGLESSVVDRLVGRDKESHSNDFPGAGHRGSAEIVDSERPCINITTSKYDPIPTPEVTKVKEALTSSFLELKALVKDPLPNALHLSEALIAEVGGKASDKGTSVEACSGEDLGGPNPSRTSVISQAATETMNPAPSAEALNQPVTQTTKSNSGIPVLSHQGIGHKPSLMERNSTARTFEWDDSIDSLPEETDSRKNRGCMDRSKRKIVSVLNNNEITKFTRRRKIKRWSLEEEDALREGVRMFGIGSWKLILNSKRDIFIERTEVDLKDKWRNMMK